MPTGAAEQTDQLGSPLEGGFLGYGPGSQGPGTVSLLVLWVAGCGESWHPTYNPQDFS